MENNLLGEAAEMAETGGLNRSKAASKSQNDPVLG
jgi:hypothetical protein